MDEETISSAFADRLKRYQLKGSCPKKQFGSQYMVNAFGIQEEFNMFSVA